MSAPEPMERMPRVQEIATAILAGGETEDLLELLVSCGLRDLAARRVALLLPAGDARWQVEIAQGHEAGALLGREVAGGSALDRALRTGDADALVHADPRGVMPPLEDSSVRVVLAPVDAGADGLGALVAEFGSPPTPAAVERLDALAALTAFALDGQSPDRPEEVEDERGRIARDLHDLAIQELFAVGMELESLQRGLRRPSTGILDPAVARSVEASVRGVEAAVAQIRQIVQSLRRERPAATLSERLRHEAGLAMAGLGFAPTLRLPEDPAAMDAEVPDEIAEDMVAVVRECLANASRHAHASAVAIAVTIFGEGVDRVAQVSVSDNGRGIDPAVTRRSGLANMASRARRHQGWVDALPLEPGTMISWRVTLPPR